MSKIFDRANNDTKNFTASFQVESYFTGFDLENKKYCKTSTNRKNVYNKEIGGIPISWNIEKNIVYTDNTDSHSLIVGSTGSKKSRLIMMPAVKLIGCAGESMIISDPKSEIYNRTATQLKELGYNIAVLNLRDPNFSNGWNPLSIPYKFYYEGDKDRAYEFLSDFATNLMSKSSFTKEPFWENSAGAFLFGLAALLFKYCKEFNYPKSCINISNVIYLRNILGSKNNSTDKNILWEYAKTDPNITSALIGTVETANETKAGILSTFDEKMHIFSSKPSLTNMLSSDEISFADLGSKKTALFLLVPDEKTTLHVLISLFIKQSYEYIIYNAQKKTSENFGKLEIRLNYLLDEFSSLPTIKDFPAMMTSARSRNIRFNIVIQSKHQLKLRYAEETETILSNCNNWIFLTSRELNFIEEISALCGKTDIGTKEKPIISVAELQRLDKEKGEILLLCGRFKPCLTRLADIKYYDDENFQILDLHKREGDNIIEYEIDMEHLREKKKQQMLDSINNDTTSTVNFGKFSNENNSRIATDYLSDVDYANILKNTRVNEEKAVDKRLEEMEENLKKVNMENNYDF